MNNSTRSVGRRSRALATTAPAAPKRRATKELLIETGERLLGQHGFDGISLREIAGAAGQANSNVVQYHFKDKAGFIGAILEDRICRLETLRCERMQHLVKDSPHYARELLKILWLPSMTIVGADGSHTFCRFLLQYMIHPKIAQHPLLQFYDMPSDDARREGFACLIDATRELRNLYTRLPQSILNVRLSGLTMMFLATVVEYDNSRLTGRGRAAPPFAVEPVLDMAVAALDANA